MTKITREEVLKLAKLSKLYLSEAEIEKFQKELSDILGYVDQLSAVDTTGLIETSQVTGLENVARKDELIEYGASPEQLMQNAPDKKDGMFKVKRVLG